MVYWSDSCEPDLITCMSAKRRTEINPSNTHKFAINISCPHTVQTNLIIKRPIASSSSAVLEQIYSGQRRSNEPVLPMVQQRYHSFFTSSFFFLGSSSSSYSFINSSRSYMSGIFQNWLSPHAGTTSMSSLDPALSPSLRA